jgi:hypothetical protein
LIRKTIDDDAADVEIALIELADPPDVDRFG